MGTISREMLKKELRDKIPNIENKNIYIWGAGSTAALYQEGFRRLPENEINIQGYVDNNSEKWGGRLGDKPIISPDELKRIEKVCVLICSPQERVMKEVGSQLDSLGMEWYLIDEIILKMHREEVLACYDLLADEESKNVYANVVMSRITGDMSELMKCQNEQYFALREFENIDQREIFVDCGAYVGDSVERFIWKKDGVFKKIIAFEPDKKNFSAMEKRIKRLKEEWNMKEDAICLYPYGVGEKCEKGKLEQNDSSNGLGSKFICGGDEQDEMIVSLDEYLQEPYSFLKADIESYEYKMLLGAKEGIKKYRPLLAICIYHNAVDMYSIPLLVKSIVPKYKMAIRHHSNGLLETVLYAWPESEI